jgi:Histidine kinase-like ATPase domain
VDQLLQIEVPADVTNLRLIRLVTLDAAERAGLDCDSADDLRIGVEELCIAVLGAATHTDADSNLSLRYRVSAGFVVVHGIARLGHEAAELGLSRVSSSILSVVADNFEIIDGGAVVRFGLAKRRIPNVSVPT